MSYTHPSVEVYGFNCDGPGCMESIEARPPDCHDRITAAHKEIRLKGWAVPGRFSSRRHYCPAHVPDGVSVKAQLTVRKSRPRLTPETFMAYVEVTDGCWAWKERCNAEGYGTWGRWFAHRLSYALYVAQIPEDVTIDHLCFNPSCVRPDHLRAVPRRLNEQRRRGYGHATCPKCQRVISGRHLGGVDEESAGKIKLLRHKESDGVNWCSGGQSIMRAAAIAPAGEG